jgi:hypothetical protein
LRRGPAAEAEAEADGVVRGDGGVEGEARALDDEDDGAAEVEGAELVAALDGDGGGVVAREGAVCGGEVGDEVVVGEGDAADAGGADLDDGDLKAVVGAKEGDEALVAREEGVKGANSEGVDGQELAGEVAHREDLARDRGVDAVIVAGAEVEGDEGAAEEAVSVFGAAEQLGEGVVFALGLEQGEVVVEGSELRDAAIDGGEEGGVVGVEGAEAVAEAASEEGGEGLILRGRVLSFGEVSADEAGISVVDAGLNRGGEGDVGEATEGAADQGVGEALEEPLFEDVRLTHALYPSR